MGDNDGIANWRPGAGLQALRLRARVYRQIRQFFHAKQVLEVETPLLCSTTNPDPHIDSFITTFTGPQAAGGIALYLQPSPEFAMKRLLSAGVGPVYQICKAFRQGELGSRHNPEFTILEWYRPGFDVKALIAEVDALILELFAAANKPLGKTKIITYQQAFQEVLGIDPLVVSTAELICCAETHGIVVQGLNSDERDTWLDLLLSHVVQPRLGRNHMTFVTNYPQSQAALARVSIDDSRTAERFELFINGVELANGFYELVDAGEQERRFEKDLQLRAKNHQHQPPMDTQLLRALQHGMPDCSGVAVGLDRVIMLLAGVEKIDEILAFPMEKI
jgi:lysyl-tRNA synthetase class 2